MLSNEEKCVQRAEEHEEKFSLPKEKRPRGAFFLKKKKIRGEGAPTHPKRAGKKLSHKRLSFPAAGCASLFFIQTREDIRNIHTHTHTHARACTRFENTKRISLENYSD